MATPREVQQRLRALGHYNGKIDGQIGPITSAAILRALEGVLPLVVAPPDPAAVYASKVSPWGRALIAQREGNKLKAYRDSVGIWTIGVGHTAAAGDPKPHASMTITAAESDAILTRDLAQFEWAVEKAVTVPLEQHEFDALVSLCFNIGAGAFAKSSLVKKLNAGDRAGAANAFLTWSRAGKSKTILLPRRQAERKQFLGA